MILVFGNQGQLASELNKYSNTLCIGRNVCDLAINNDFQKFIMEDNIEGVINASGYTNTIGAEDNVSDAMKLNCEVPLKIFMSCAEKSIPFIHISTDYVFDGKKTDPYVEGDHANPIGMYGLSKLKGEEAICNIGGSFAIIRTSWLFSQFGKNFVKTMIEKGKNLSDVFVVNDQVGGPTSAKSLASVCIRALDKIRYDHSLCGIYHFSGYPYVSWADFAREIFICAGFNTKVNNTLSGWFVESLLSITYQSLRIQYLTNPESLKHQLIDDLWLYAP